MSSPDPSTTEWVPIWNPTSTGPVGPTGPEGPEGPEGPQGPQGEAGISAGRIFYYAVTDASDIATYKTMLEAPSAAAEQTVGVSCSGTADVLVGAFATDPGVPGAVDYPAGTAYRRFYARTSAGSARLHLLVYLRTGAGVETLVRDEFSDPFTNTAVALIQWIASAPSGGSMTVTDRIVNKVYAQRVSGAAPLTVTVHFEGTTHTSQIQTTISAGAVGPQGPPGPTGPAGADAAIVADAQYWVSTPHAVLSAERNIGALATGYVKATTAAGVATPSTVATIPTADGGTGVTTGLTVLNATNLTSGTVPAAALSAANLPAHASRHNAGGADAMAVDSAAGTGSLRTLGTSATSACAGNDARLTDTRTPSAHHATHESGGSDPIANAAWTNQANVFTADQTLSTASPTLTLQETDQPADLKKFRLIGEGQALYTQAVNDAASVATGYTVLDRTGLLSASGGLAGPAVTVSNAGTAAGVILEDTTQAANAKRWKEYQSAGSFRIRPINDAGAITDGGFEITRAGNSSVSGSFTSAGKLTGGSGLFYNSVEASGGISSYSYIYPGERTTHYQTSWWLASDATYGGLYTNAGMYAEGGYSERLRTTKMGEWVDFTPSVSTTSGNVTLNANYGTKYMLIGKTCFIAIYWVVVFNVGTNTLMYLNMPAGLTTGPGTYTGSTLSYGIDGTAVLQAPPSSTLLTIYKDVMATGTYPTSVQNMAGVAIIPLT